MPTLRISTLIALLLLPVTAVAEEILLIDGETADWASRTPLHADPAGDSGKGRVDFGRLWITHDAYHLVLRLELGREVGLQDDDTGVVLYLDADADATTGLAVRGLGAELEYHFSRRGGRLHMGTVPSGGVRGEVTSRLVDARALGLVSAPTVTSEELELAFDRHRQLDEGPLFPGRKLRLAFAVEGGDALPDGPGGVTYEMAGEGGGTVEPLTLAKEDPSHLRLLSYNTNNRLFEPHRKDAYRRILAAIRPDVVLLQEVRDHTSDDVLTYLEEKLPPGRSWHHARVGGEASVVLSPFPVEKVHALGESGAFVLDARERYGTPILLVGLSTPCCDNERERGEEIELISRFLYDARTPGGELDLPPRTPLLVVGDANLVGSRRQRDTLLSGTSSGATRLAPDWDATPLADLVPRHTHRPLTFTWYGRGYTPGRLDYVIYSDSVAAVGKGYVLFTPSMPEVDLKRYGLRRDDTSVATDHLPVVADFVFSGK